MHNPNKIKEGNDLPKKWWLKTKTSELFKLFSKKESGKDNVEKNNLLHENWEKVVIVRSNWEPVLWVIVWEMRWQYKVLYNVWNQIREKDLTENEIKENEQSYDKSKLINSVQDGPDYKIWEEVLIPRTNKEPSKAYIISYDETTWEYSVWFGENEEMFSKSVSRKRQGKNVENATILWSRYVGKGKTLTKEILDEYNTK